MFIILTKGENPELWFVPKTVIVGKSYNGNISFGDPRDDQEFFTLGLSLNSCFSYGTESEGKFAQMDMDGIKKLKEVITIPYSIQNFKKRLCF